MGDPISERSRGVFYLATKQRSSFATKDVIVTEEAAEVT